MAQLPQLALTRRQRRILLSLLDLREDYRVTVMTIIRTPIINILQGLSLQEVIANTDEDFIMIDQVITEIDDEGDNMHEEDKDNALRTIYWYLHAIQERYNYMIMDERSERAINNEAPLVGENGREIFADLDIITQMAEEVANIHENNETEDDDDEVQIVPPPNSPVQRRNLQDEVQRLQDRHDRLEAARRQALDDAYEAERQALEEAAYPTDRNGPSEAMKKQLKGAILTQEEIDARKEAEAKKKRDHEEAVLKLIDADTVIKRQRLLEEIHASFKESMQLMNMQTLERLQAEGWTQASTEAYNNWRGIRASEDDLRLIGCTRSVLLHRHYNEGSSNSIIEWKIHILGPDELPGFRTNDEPS